jgi:uroporphyrinogen decarboxylase
MPNQMTSKERVLTAFARQEPDRVPVNYLCNPGIDGRLKEHFGLDAEDGEGLLQALEVDFRTVGPRYVGPRLHPEVPGRAVDPVWGIRTRWIEHETGGYWDYCDFPLQHATLEQVEAWPMPSPDDYDYSHIAEDCRQYKDYAVCLYSFPDIINSTGMIRTMEQVLVDLALDDEAGLLYIDRKLQLTLEGAARALEAAQGGIDILWLAEDLGSQIAPMISLEMFRKHIRPRHQPFVDLTRHHDIHAMEHTCGSSSWAYDDFIEMGITVVDTLQPEAKDMAPAYLKARFGDKLSFHGCISTAGPLAYGTIDDIINDVRTTLEIMKPGGGYALAPTHCIQDNTPTENAVAMYEAAREWGRY